MADEYNAAADVNQNPTADAEYGSYNKYIYCQEHGMEKFMKFPMYEKGTKDKEYRDDSFRTVNFRIDEEGTLRSPNEKAFHFAYRKTVSGNQYGRQEVGNICEDCNGCPYAKQCMKTDNERFDWMPNKLRCMKKYWRTWTASKEHCSG